MSTSSPSAMNELACYRIRVTGYVSEGWVRQYLDMKTLVVRREAGFITTEMTGRVAEQEDLIGLLNLLYDMRHVLISVKRLTVDQYEGSAPNG